MLVGIRESIDKAVREYVPRASEIAVGSWVFGRLACNRTRQWEPDKD
jgi:hypothetical protein